MLAKLAQHYEIETVASTLCEVTVEFEGDTVALYKEGQPLPTTELDAILG